MATENKLFVYAKTKANFTPVASNYDNCLVFIADTNEIYTHGDYFGLSKSDAAEIAKIAGIGARLTTAEANITSATNSANSKIKSVTASNGSAITASTTNYATTVGLKLATGENAGNVTLTQSANGLKAEITLPKYVSGVSSTDKVLSVTDSTLSSTISLTYGADSSNGNAKTIFLRGKGNSVISKIDATEFIKDKVVSSAELVSTAESGVTIEVPYIKLVFNDASTPVRFSVKSLIDVYNGSNLNLSSSYAAATTYAAPAVGDSVDTAIGKLTKGVADAKSSGVTSFGGQTGAITVDTATTTNGAVKFAMSSKKLTATVNGLKSAAYTESSAYATSAQGTKADNALQSISKGTDGSYVTTTVGAKSSNNQTIGVAVKVQAISSASTAAKGLAESSDVKTYVDTQINNLNLGWANLD